MQKRRRIGAVLCALTITSIIFAASPPAQNVLVPTSLYMDSSSKGDKVVGFTPSQIRHAYGFDQIANQGAGQTIGLVVSFDHPRIEQDLAVFNSTFNLRECTTSNGCFRKVFAGNTPPMPGPAYPALSLERWQLEIALDVEWAHAIAPQANILLVEVNTDKDTVVEGLQALLDGVDLAVQKGATAVSMSWGVPEFAGETSLDNHFVASNVSFFASAGDSGNPAAWPAASPFVTAVGGTKLQLDAQGNINHENGWNDGGGGLSFFEVEPAYQSAFGIPSNPFGKRGVPDVAYVAFQGVAVYDSMPLFGKLGWHPILGTSVGAPQWAAMISIANSMRKAAQKPLISGANTALYKAALSAYDTNYNDITVGTNTSGQCGQLCQAAPGYDYATGLGSPQANHLIPALFAQ